MMTMTVFASLAVTQLRGAVEAQLEALNLSNT